MEKIVVNIIIKFIDENNLSEPLQLAYRAAHSTETALLKLKDDIMTSLHHRQSVFLVLPDFSGAFDILWAIASCLNKCNENSPNMFL